MLSHDLLVALAALIAVAAGAGKPYLPTIKPPFDWDRMETDFLTYLTPTNSSVRNWQAGWIPKACSDFAQDHNLNESDFKVFNVYYEDCSEPWIFCRHNDAAASEHDMIEMFGRMPVDMRSYVRQFIASSSLNNSVAAQWSYPGDITIIADDNLAHILVHEMSHGLDFMALQEYGSPFSDTPIWRKSYMLDFSSPSDYSRTNFAEDFAESGLVGVYDKIVPGGVGRIQPNWWEVFWQFRTYQRYLLDQIVPGGRCRSRVANSETVAVDVSGTSRAVGSEKPDVGFTDLSIKVVKTEPSRMGLTLVHPEEH